MVSVGGRPFLSVTSYARLIGWVAEGRIEAPALVDLLLGDHTHTPAVRRELRALRRHGPPAAIGRILADGLAQLSRLARGQQGTRTPGQASAAGTEGRARAARRRVARAGPTRRRARSTYAA